MRRSAFVLAAALVPAVAAAQQQAGDVSRAVAGGGIAVAGWTGRIDAAEAAKGLTLEQAKLVKEGDGLKVTTGPSLAYWNPANKASGSYTVKATFREPAFQALNDHPHPYGIVIGGNDMGTDQQSYLYCAAYGNGTAILRGFGPAAFRVGGGRPVAAPSINKASAKGEPVTQEIAITVSPEKVECSVNGAVVISAPIADVVGAGKLKSTDGIYGIRFGHNTEAIVTGLTMVKK